MKLNIFVIINCFILMVLSEFSCNEKPDYKQIVKIYHSAKMTSNNIIKIILSDMSVYPQYRLKLNSLEKLSVSYYFKLLR